MLDIKKACLCGSGLRYGECCKNKPALTDKRSMQLLAETRKHHNSYQSSCIMLDADGKTCGKPCIRSHTLQENGILSRLAVNGHVYVLGENANDDSFSIFLKTSGINRSSIFKCLCSEHDDRLFSEMEKRYYIGSDQQNYQLALKENINSLWKLLAAQDLYLHWSKEHNIFVNEMIICEFIQNKLDLARVRYDFQRLNKILYNRNYNQIESIRVTLGYKIMFAVSAPLHFTYDLTGKQHLGGEDIFTKSNGKLCLDCPPKYPTMYVSVFPTDDKSEIILSWFREDKNNLGFIIQQLTELSTDDKLKMLNVLLPSVCENIIFSPLLIDSWTESSKNELSALFHPLTLDLYNGDTLENGIDFYQWKEQVHFNMFQNLFI